MIDKRIGDLATAVAPIFDGAVVMVGGFGNSGIPAGLLTALLEQGARELTIISNNAGAGEDGISSLLREKRVSKVICSYPRSPGSIWFERRYEAGEIELEIVPQGTLAERIRAAGAGLGGFLTPTAYGTLLAEGKETREIDGVGYVFEKPLAADFALIRAEAGDRWGNLRYHATARNFNPVMATAASHSIAEVRHLSGDALDPEAVITPGIFVDRIVEYGVRP
ncbi:3-oxoacid CoA-transferase subunit A [Paracoccus saliphilus]|uniref:3-oxoadipate CoA-transferase alpha subunit n=1 Tax=Paracoccus saliphilus TaxID=405559 RepID=A0AA46A4I0_9RHOB|nr:3-oxoadipate CoA-transferase alpha subunit [Paracoccus saliphilus]